AAWALLVSVEACLVTTKLWELAQTASVEPIFGSGAAPPAKAVALFHSFIIQMPSQVRGFLPCRKATAWASLATFLGLEPCSMLSTCQVRVPTPGSELHVA